eukprot:5318800-Amphidinium_carterae.1
MPLPHRHLLAAHSRLHQTQTPDLPDRRHVQHDHDAFAPQPRVPVGSACKRNPIHLGLCKPASHQDQVMTACRQNSIKNESGAGRKANY